MGGESAHVHKADSRVSLSPINVRGTYHRTGDILTVKSLLNYLAFEGKKRMVDPLPSQEQTIHSWTDSLV